jgi:putative membrane protein
MKTSMFAVGVFAVALAGGSIAAAQTTQPKAAGQPATHGAASAKAPDQVFAHKAAAGGMAEVEMGQLASKNAESPDVKQFGERMVTDHSKANDELKQLAEKQQITLPTTLDPKHKALHDRLAKLNGAAFDKAYMSAMVKDHQEDVAAFQRESKAGKNDELKAWASKTLPTLEEHLKLAKETASKVGATTSTGTKPKGTAKKPSGR